MGPSHCRLSDLLDLLIEMPSPQSPSHLQKLRFSVQQLQQPSWRKPSGRQCSCSGSPLAQWQMAELNAGLVKSCQLKHNYL